MMLRYAIANSIAEFPVAFVRSFIDNQRRAFCRASRRCPVTRKAIGLIEFFSLSGFRSQYSRFLNIHNEIIGDFCVRLILIECQASGRSQDQDSRYPANKQRECLCVMHLPNPVGALKLTYVANDQRDIGFGHIRHRRHIPEGPVMRAHAVLSSRLK